MFAGKLALLVQVFELGELRTSTKEDLKVLLLHMHVTGGDVDDQRMRGTASIAGTRRLALARSGPSTESLREHLANETLDLGPIQVV